ncbi:MAG: hypothetical protein OEZ38_04530, partial [Gammaproteobacteria bacterium]|nr:hypothetical protein [Gammaproteobacteria bacterium]
MNDHLQNNKYRFPWQHNNHFKLLVDGPVFFPAMLSAIENAQHYILLEMYLIKSGRLSRQFITSLVRA